MSVAYELGKRRFQTISLGDARLHKQAILLTERMAFNPTGSLVSACHGWVEVTAAYRIIDNQ